MRRRHLRLGALLLLAFPLAAFVKSCGFSAKIDVIQLFYDKTQFVTSSRCDAPDQNQVDILYTLITGDGRPIGGGDSILPSGPNGGVRVEFLEDLAIEGQAGKTIRATLAGNGFVAVSKAGEPRGMSLLMDNSRSLDGFDETTGTRISLTDPGDARIAGAQNFFNSPTFLASDRATLIAFHGNGAGVDPPWVEGVIPKFRANDDDPPSVAWFTGNKASLSEKLTELKGEEGGKTPLFDGIGVGAKALKTLPGTVQPVMITFSDGPNNSSQTSIDDAKNALSGTRPCLPTQAEPNPPAVCGIPFFAVALTPQLGATGEQELRDIACSTKPKGAVLLASPSTLRSRFEPLQYAVTGYWKAAFNLTAPSGLVPGKYNVTGRLLADPTDAPRTCATEGQACPDGMECDAGQNTCFVRVNFSYTVN